MARPKKSVPVNLDKKRNLKYGFNALCAIEEELSKSILEVTKDGNIKMKDLRVIIWAGLLHEDEDLTIEEVGDLLDEADSINDVVEAMGKALNLAFGDKKADNNQGKDDEQGK